MNITQIKVIIVLNKIKEYYDEFVDFYFDAYQTSSTMEEADELKCIDAYSLAHTGCKAQQVDIILGDLPPFVVQMVIEYNGIKAL